MSEKNELSFEEAIQKLEEIVDALEEGDIPLENAIEKYKEGMELAKICQGKLRNAEEQLTEILNSTGETESFNIEEA